MAYVVGATHFPWVGAAIETQLAIPPKSNSALFTGSNMTGMAPHGRSAGGAGGEG